MTTIRIKALPRRFGVIVGAGALCLTAFVGVAPASAATTHICLNSHVVGTPGSGTLTCSSGGAYGTDVNTSDTTSGSLDATANGGKATFSGGGITITCTTASLAGSSPSNGSSLTFTSFTFSGCTDAFGGSAQVTANALASWGGSVVYNTGTGKDGTFTVTAPPSTYQWKLVDGFNSCEFAPNAAGGGSITGDDWDPGNTGSPLTSGHGGVNFAGSTFNLFHTVSGICPSSGTFKAGFDITGTNPSGVLLAVTS